MFWTELRQFLRWAFAPKLGIPAVAIRIADLLADAPELTAALYDPDVQRVLSDPASRRELAQLLRMVALLPERAQPAPAQPEPDPETNRDPLVN